MCILMHDYDAFDEKTFKQTIARTMKIDVPFQGLSLGLAFYPEDSEDPSDLISLADQAMYVDKRTGTTHR